MFEKLRRDYESIIRRFFKSRGGVIENRQPPIPDVIQLESADAISKVFDFEVRNLEIAEQARRSGRYIESNSAALGAEIPNSGCRERIEHNE
jgi:hypothetical protein